MLDKFANKSIFIPVSVAMPKVIIYTYKKELKIVR